MATRAVKPEPVDEIEQITDLLKKLAASEREREAAVDRIIALSHELRAQSDETRRLFPDLFG